MSSLVQFQLQIAFLRATLVQRKVKLIHKIYIYIHRVSQEECARLRESVP